MAGASRESVIEFELLRGRQNERVLKELCVASATASETVRFKSSYKMDDHGSSQNGINCADGHVKYEDCHAVVTEAVAGFANLYTYGVSKFMFLSKFTGRTIRNLGDVDCPTLDAFNLTHWWNLSCHKFTKLCLRNQNCALHLWLIDALSTNKSFCPMPI